MQPEVHPETGDEDAAGDCMPALVAGRRQRQRCAQAAEHADLGGAVDTVVDRAPCLSRGGECRIQGLFDPLLKLGGAYLAVVKKTTILPATRLGRSSRTPSSGASSLCTRERQSRPRSAGSFTRMRPGEDEAILVMGRFLNGLLRLRSNRGRRVESLTPIPGRPADGCFPQSPQGSPRVKDHALTTVQWLSGAISTGQRSNTGSRCGCQKPRPRGEPIRLA